MKAGRQTESQLAQELGILRRRLAKLEKINRSRALQAWGAVSPAQPSILYEWMNRLRLNDHLCLLYESQEEWRAAITPFITAGLRRGERCIYILGNHSADQVRSCLREEGVNPRDVEASGQLLILRGTAPSPAEDCVTPDQMIALLVAEAGRSLDEGYSSMRMTQEVGPSCEARFIPEGLLEYEAKLNRDFFTHYPCIGMCQYDRWKSDPETVKNAIMTHPLIVRGSQVHRNLYYTPPEQFLDLTCDEHEVQEMLENIEQEGEIQKRIRFLSNVLRLSSQPFSASYPDGRIMYCNSAFSTLSGYSEDELRTMTWRIDITPPRWRELETKMLKELDRTGQPQRYEKEIVRKDGSRVPVEVFIHQICGEKGDVQCHYAFITDITERKRAERELRRQRDKALAMARELFSQHHSRN